VESKVGRETFGSYREELISDTRNLRKKEMVSIMK
jgi:hypothetical protein